jgi:hypothetical protein
MVYINKQSQVIMDSIPFQMNETESSFFQPSRNILLLPGGLSLIGILLLLFNQFNHLPPAPETNFLIWGFIIIGLVGVVLNIVSAKHYRLYISDQALRYYPSQDSAVKIDIPLDSIRTVKVQQTAIGKIFRYGNLILEYDSEEIYLQDIEQPETIKNLLPQNYQ